MASAGWHTTCDAFPNRVSAKSRTSCVAMGYLLAAVGCAVTFGLIQRAAQRQHRHYFVTTSTNYVVATLVALTWVAAQGHWQASPIVFWVGALNGIGFAVLIVLQFFMLGQRGVGVTYALGSIALVAPITLSLVVFNEQASVLMLAGVALLVVAAPLIAYRRTPVQAAAKAGRYWAIVLALLAFTACTLISWKIVTEATPSEDRGLFVTMTFAGAVAASAATLAVRRWSSRAALGRPMPRLSIPASLGVIPVPIAAGVVLGLCNVGNLWMFLNALNEIPGAVAFPVHMASTVLLTAVAGTIIWRERHGPLAILGIAAAVIGLILVNV